MSTDGTVRIKGLTFADLEQCKASTAVIVTCEEIVPEHYLRLDPDQNALPPFLVDAVVPVPYGAHPTACPYFYDYDPAHLNRYKAVAKDDEQLGGLAGGVGVRRREPGPLPGQGRRRAAGAHPRQHRRRLRARPGPEVSEMTDASDDHVAGDGPTAAPPTPRAR